MSGRGRAAVAGDSQGDGGRSRPIGWEAGAEGPLTAFRATLVVRVGARLGSTIKWGISDCAVQARIGLLARTHLRGWTRDLSWRTMLSRWRWKGRMGTGSSHFVISAGHAGLVPSRT